MRLLGLVKLLVVAAVLVACSSSSSGPGGDCGGAKCDSFGGACETSADCPIGAKYCAADGTGAKVCQPELDTGRACESQDDVRDLLDEAAAEVGRDACDLGQEHGDLDLAYPKKIAMDAFRPTFFQSLYHAPLAIPAAKRRIRDEAKAAAAGGHPVSGPLRTAARLWDEELRSGGSPVAARSFEDEVVALLGDQGEARRTAITQDAADLPAGLKQELAPIVAALVTARELRDRAIPEGADLARWWRAPMGMFVQMRESVSNAQKVDLSKSGDQEFLLQNFGYGLLARAAVILAEAVERSALAGLSVPAGSYRFDVETPWGQIAIRGTGNDVWRDDGSAAGGYLLAVDAGGDDVYEVPVGATASTTNGVSLAVDLGGADTYTYVKYPSQYDEGVHQRLAADAAGRRPTLPRHSLSEVRRQGAGTLGVGMLLDLGSGRDRYESLRFSQGSGVLGVGVLYDDGGNDHYQAETVVQGAGQLGLGLLVDGGGDDEYLGYSVSQGAVHVKAVGMLLDHGGRDRYFTSPANAYSGPLDGYDNFYEYGINQGASWGRRGDLPQDGLKNDSYSSGGIGVLMDLGPEADSYTCGAFCQGTGYWFGTGLLYDEGGSDTYFGRFFAGGAGVHFGLGIVHDGGGDDVRSGSGMNFGTGDDLSLAWFEDRGGNDRYEAGRNSLGNGSEKGVGIFLELDGQDTYETAEWTVMGYIEDPPSMRTSASSRYELRTQAIFADGGGSDTYARGAHFLPDPVGNERTWLHPWVDADAPGSGVLSGPVSYPVPWVYAAGLDR